MNRLLLSIAFSLFLYPVFAQGPAVLSVREQAAVVDGWLEDRIQQVLPNIMTETGIDLWIVVSREYNEDPVIRTLLPTTWHAARRRTILVMYQPSPNAPVETYAVARYDVGKSFKKAWDPEAQPDQWKALLEIIEAKKPKKIGLNFSKDYGHADGLTHFDYEELMRILPAQEKAKVVSAQTLAVRWLETRTAAEMAAYKHIQELAHYIIAEGLSDRVITPGVTTTEDVVWFYREKIKEMKLDTNQELITWEYLLAHQLVVGQIITIQALMIIVAILQLGIMHLAAPAPPVLVLSILLQLVMKLVEIFTIQLTILQSAAELWVSVVVQVIS